LGGGAWDSDPNPPRYERGRDGNPLPGGGVKRGQVMKTVSTTGVVTERGPRAGEMVDSLQTRPIGYGVPPCTHRVGVVGRGPANPDGQKKKTKRKKRERKRKNKAAVGLVGVRSRSRICINFILPISFFIY